MPSINPSSPEAILKDWRILVVDDQADNLNLAGAVLGSRGADVVLVDNAREALNLLESYKPTVILLDLAMPDMDGWELIRLIRSSSENHIPVIALSVRLSLSDTEKALAAGFNGFISKPYSIAGLVSQIQDIVGHSRIRV